MPERMEAHTLQPHRPHEFDDARAQTVGRIVCAARLVRLAVDALSGELSEYYIRDIF
jgi:hypothetical protein